MARSKSATGQMQSGLNTQYTGHLLLRNVDGLSSLPGKQESAAGRELSKPDLCTQVLQQIMS